MHPHLLELNGVVIHTYHVALGGVFIFLFIGGYFLSEKAGVSKKDAVNFFLIAFITGVIGWRLITIVLKFTEIVEEPEKLQRYLMWGNSFGGIAFIGGLSSYFYIRRKVKNVWKFYDELVPLIFFAFAFLKIFGCFLTGCCFGLPTNLPWGVVFPRESVVSLVYPGVKLHPVQLYEATFGFLYGILAIWINAKKKRDGETSMWAVPLAAVERLSMGFLRWRNYAIGVLSLTQVFAIVVIVVWMPFLISFYRKPITVEEEPSQGW